MQKWPGLRPLLLRHSLGSAQEEQGCGAKAEEDRDGYKLSALLRKFFLEARSKMCTFGAPTWDNKVKGAFNKKK